jgi:hypothetical protein
MQLVLANLLLAHDPLKALIGNRIHWDAMGQGQALPFVVMFAISRVNHYHMGGRLNYVMSRVQFDCRGTTAAQARAVAEAISNRLSGFRGDFSGFRFLGCFEEGQRTRYDKDGNVTWFTDSRDYLIHWSE